ncbi:hypothetical protein OZN62_12115 [Aurantiacibacter sp. MUD11]|uniref:hypothetical protein n=1 Tax=Aurantiacibacter sp. MUD11 TaxID=3003265 RepID=UPI0022AA438E|nr:hypothetical protein [Aurantiacibacter sp. MUD11]WAT17647.1 hypothetical protein OZN62_12115 [Aurantiacibacter sp. MUD11]
MDLNELLANHQRALFNQRSARTMRDRETYFDLVGYYAERIRKLRISAGLPRYHWTDEPRPPKE